MLKSAEPFHSVITQTTSRKLVAIRRNILIPRHGPDRLGQLPLASEAKTGRVNHELFWAMFLSENSSGVTRAINRPSWDASKSLRCQVLQETVDGRCEGLFWWASRGHCLALCMLRCGWRSPHRAALSHISQNAWKHPIVESSFEFTHIKVRPDAACRPPKRVFPRPVGTG